MSCRTATSGFSPANNPHFNRSPLALAVHAACTLGLAMTMNAAFVTPAQAAEPVASHADAQRRYDIPAGTLDQALNHYAAASGILLVIDGTLTKDRTSKGLHGLYTVRAGLSALLNDNGLEAVMQPNGSYALRKLPEVPLQNSAATLPAVTVSADPYATVGYVAKRSTTGTKTDTPILEVPQSISVITAEQITDQGAQNLQEVLGYTAGVRAEQWGLDNRGDWFSLRGGSEGSVYLDGLKAVMVGSWGYVRNEPYAFDRVEVVRGPSAVMGGQNEPGGMVNLVSKRPQAETHREVNVQYGNYNHKQISADLTGPLNQDGTLLYRLVALSKDSDTQVDHAFDKRQYVAPSLTWRPDAGTELTLFASYQHDDTTSTVGFFPWEGMLLPAPNGRIPTDTFIGEPGWDKYEGEQTRLGYEFRHQLNDAWTLSHHLRYEHQTGSHKNVYAAWWDGILPDGRSVNRIAYAGRSSAEIVNADLQMEGKLDFGTTKHTVLFGVDGIRSRDDSRYADDVSLPPLDVYNPVYGAPMPDFVYGPAAPSTTRQLGVFLQDQIKFNERWVLLAGLRHDSVKSDVKDSPDAGIDESALSKRLGLVYLADGGWAPYLSYSESFQAVAGTNKAGDPFKPKRGKQLEAGVKWAPVGSNLMASAAVYELKEKNRLSPDPMDPDNQIQNSKGEVTVRGLELEATASYATWDFTGNYTYTDAKVTGTADPADPYLDTHVFSVPEHSAAVWAVHKFSIGNVAGFRAGAGVRYVGSSWDGLDQLKTPSHTLLDAMFSFEDGPWRYTVNATNLTDKVYFSTCVDRGDCWYGNRRKVVATVSYNW